MKKFTDDPERLRDFMLAIGKGIDDVINHERSEDDPKNGFVLLLFPVNENIRQSHLISGGVKREDIATLLRAQLEKLDFETPMTAYDSEGRNGPGC